MEQICRLRIGEPDRQTAQLYVDAANYNIPLAPAMYLVRVKVNGRKAYVKKIMLSWVSIPDIPLRYTLYIYKK